MKNLTLVKPAVLFKPTLLGLVFLLLTTMAGYSYSIQVNGLYDVVVPVEDRSAKARSEAFRAGFLQMIKKITGSSEVLNHAELTNELPSAERYISGFGYQLAPPATETGLTQLMLQINFSSQAIEKFLRSKRLPIWPSDREPILVWMVIDDAEFGRHLAGEQWFPEAINDLTSAAAQRGLPINMPILDLQDKLNLPVKAVWELEPSLIAQASARYQSDNWLVLRFFKTGNGSWRGSSWLNTNGKQLLENHQGDSLQQFLMNAMENVADIFSSQYAFIPQNAGGGIQLTFEGLVGFMDFKKLRETLEDMEIVSDFKLLGMSNNEVTIEVSIDGEQQLFYDALQRNRNIKFDKVQSRSIPHLVWQNN